eukprot:gene9984-3510_t
MRRGGGERVSAVGFARMAAALRDAAPPAGVVMVLEGGYDPPAVADGVEGCAERLRRDRDGSTPR